VDVGVVVTVRESDGDGRRQQEVGGGVCLCVYGRARVAARTRCMSRTLALMCKWIGRIAALLTNVTLRDAAAVPPHFRAGREGREKEDGVRG
jgi:hypothetical protein